MRGFPAGVTRLYVVDQVRAGSFCRVVVVVDRIKFVEAFHVKRFNLGSSPGGLAQKRQARFDAWVKIEASDRNRPSQGFPPVIVH